jgi:L-lactate dehydrogenase complex protein LldE
MLSCRRVRARPCYAIFIRSSLPKTRCLVNRLNLLVRRTYELSEFLVRVMSIEGVGATFAGKVGYHPACHLSRELGVVDEPQRLITHVEG